MTKSFPELLRHLRTARGLSQKELADAVGVGQSAIANLEVGYNRPSVDMIKRLALYFGISTAVLVDSIATEVA